MLRALPLVTMGCLLFFAPEALQAQSKAEKVFVSGNIRVTSYLERVDNERVRNYSLFRDGVLWGTCLNDARYCRMPTTYYHSHGPLGMVFQKFNWFPGPVNTYRADARLPASLVAQGALLGPETMLNLLGVLWSEPPVGVIGMESGTVASYARPFQRFDFFEQTKEIIELHERTPAYFSFISQARSRGAAISVFHGSPRQQLAQHAPDKYYQLLIMEACSGEDGEKLALDLLTREGIAECMRRVADDGVLCVHASHRYIDLPLILAAIGRDLQMYVRVGHDLAPATTWGGREVGLDEVGHSSSEWVVFARHKRILDEVCKTPSNYEELFKKSEYLYRYYRSYPYWSTPKVSKNLWTDKGPNLLHGVLRGHPFAIRYSAAVGPIDDAVWSVMKAFGGARYAEHMNLRILPHSVDQLLVERQLAARPDVRQLWDGILFIVPKLPKAQTESDKLFASGNIRVIRHDERVSGEAVGNYQLLRDNINFGTCLNDDRYCRMPMTYYHPEGPLGVVFQKFNWFPGPANTYDADARLPASLVAQGALLGPETLANLLGALWSEPAVAVIGMEAGVPASYARPYQQFHFYEPSKALIELHERAPAYFKFIPQARARGTAISVFHGSPRQQLAQCGPRQYYHLMVMEACSGENGEKLFLDLLTREGIAECMKHLADDGILCIHTSHRFLDLPPILAAIGNDLKLHVREGHDQFRSDYLPSREVDITQIGHYASQWVLFARHERILDEVCKTPANYDELLKKDKYYRYLRSQAYWSTPPPSTNLWTDKGPNLLHGVLRRHPFDMRYGAGIGPLVVGLQTGIRAFGGFPPAENLLGNIYYLPQSVSDWLVRRQLADHPDVRELWP